MKLKESIFSRRQFINSCLAGIGTLVSYVMTHTLISALLPPREEQDNIEEIKMPATEMALDPNSAKSFFFGRTPALLIKSEEGELIALKAVCTHFECLVHYDPALKYIVCPCHQGFFDIHGNNLKGPPPQPLTRYQINQETDGLLIRRESNA
ncbi:Rieske domain-containing protein [Gammaproteobacteria bacterium]